MEETGKVSGQIFQTRANLQLSLIGQICNWTRLMGSRVTRALALHGRTCPSLGDPSEGEQNPLTDPRHLYALSVCLRARQVCSYSLLSRTSIVLLEFFSRHLNCTWIAPWAFYNEWKLHIAALVLLCSWAGFSITFLYALCFLFFYCCVIHSNELFNASVL